MIKFRTLTLLAACFVLAAVSAQAQKIGYVNSQLLLADMPEVKAAETDLVSYREQQEKLLKTKIEGFQTELAELERKNTEGELTPKQIQEEQTRMQTKQQEIQQFEASVNEQLAKRREEKFQPVFDRVNSAIAEIAKADNYQYVFDMAAGGVILYADESMDLTSKVKTEMGNAAPAPSAPAAEAPTDTSGGN